MTWWETRRQLFSCPSPFEKQHEKTYLYVSSCHVINKSTCLSQSKFGIPWNQTRVYFNLFISFQRVYCGKLKDGLYEMVLLITYSIPLDLMKNTQFLVSFWPAHQNMILITLLSKKMCRFVRAFPARIPKVWM